MNRILKSSSLLVFQRFAQRFLGLISTIILARLLTPEDFGIVAIAMLALWFAQTLCDASTESYILQQQRVRKVDLDSSWTLDLILKTMAFLFMCLIAPVVSYFKEQPELTLLISATGLVIFLEALKNPILIIKKRRQMYGLIVRLSIFAKLASLLVSIPIALIYKSYWSIILGALSAEIFVVISTYRISSYKPKLTFSRIPQQWHFSKWLIPRSILGYFRNHLDGLLVSTAYSKAELGAYNNMKYFSSIPMLQFLSPLMEPLHVELGKVGDQNKELEYKSKTIFIIIGILASIIISFLYVNSDSIVRIILGNQWSPYSEIFGYFAFLTVPFVFISHSFRILMIIKKTKIIFLYELLSTTIIAGVLAFSLNLTIERFLIVKVAVESVLATTLYFYVFKNTFSSNPIPSMITFFGLTTIGILALDWVSKLIPENYHPVFFVLLSGVAAVFLITAYFIVFLKFFATERQRNLLKSLANPLLHFIN